MKYYYLRNVVSTSIIAKYFVRLRCQYVPAVFFDNTRPWVRRNVNALSHQDLRSVSSSPNRGCGPARNVSSCTFTNNNANLPHVFRLTVVAITALSNVS